jgi:AcrR family transcriptional regulator
MEAGERIDERRGKFLMAGLEAFADQGYANTGIRSVCRVAGLTERYFYESFENKEDLLSAVFKMLVDELKDEFVQILTQPDASPREKVVRGIRMFYSKLRDDPRRARVQLFEILGVSPRIDREYLDAMRMMSGMVTLLTGAVFPGAKMDGTSGWIISTGISGAMIHIAMQWVLNGYDVALEDLSGRMTEIFFAGGEGWRKA